MPISLPVGEFCFCSPRSGLRDPLNGRGDVATRPSCVPLLILLPSLERWDHLDGRGDEANLPASQQGVILSSVWG